MSEPVEVRLARIEEMLRAHCMRNEEKNDLLSGNVQGLKRRLTDMEQWRSETKGGWAVLVALTAGGGAAGAILAKLGSFFGG